MRSNLTKSAFCAALLTGLAACSGGSEAYPSLAMRPFESGVAPAAPEPAPLPIRPVVTPERLASIMADAAAAESAFLSAEERAGRLARAAAGQPIESNARAAALVALADLDVQRGKTAGALAALDALAAEAAGALSSDPALTAAQGEIAATLVRQDEGIARLWGAMGS
jgi:GAF domain-containing protein